MLDNYKCIIANKNQIIEKWDEEIKRHNYSEEWKIYKEHSLSNMDTRIVYMGILDGKIITEATAIISGKDKCIENKDDLVDNGKVYLSAFRTNKEYENQGYFSKLYKSVESDLKSKGFKSLTLGVEPKEIRNIHPNMRTLYDNQSKHSSFGIEHNHVPYSRAPHYALVTVYIFHYTAFHNRVFVYFGVIFVQLSGES
jgi:hypothetical protein